MPGYGILFPPDRAVERPLWRALVTADAPRSIRQLHQQSHAAPNAIQHRLERWVRAGLVTRIEGTPKRFAMNDTVPRTPEPPIVSIDGKVTPRRRSQRERMWSAMRVLKSFELPILMATAEVSRRSAEDYLNCLQRSGHLRCQRRGNSATGEWSTYQLARNTGRLAPSVSHRLVSGVRQREVVDRNTGTRTDISPAAVSLRRSSKTIADGGVS